MSDWAKSLGGEERSGVIKCQKPHRVLKSVQVYGMISRRRRH